MSKKVLYFLIVPVVVLTLLNLAGLWYVNHQLKREVVIDVLRVFNEFKMKKELEERVAVKLEGYNNRLDSLKGVYTVLEKAKAPKEQLQQLGVQINETQQTGQDAYTKSNQTINDEVWKRLNTLIDEYGKMKDYRIMIGANGMGTVLYNDKSMEQTDELINYVNSRYEKGS